MPSTLNSLGGTVASDIYEAVESTPSSNPSSSTGSSAALTTTLLAVLLTLFMLGVTCTTMLVVMDVKHVAQETVAQVQTTYFLLFIGVLAVLAVAASKWGKAPGDKCQGHMHKLACCAGPPVLRHFCGPPAVASAAASVVIDMVPQSAPPSPQRAPSPLGDRQMLAVPHNASRCMEVKTAASHKNGKRRLHYEAVNLVEASSSSS